jgi:putative membrane protein
MKLIPLTPYFNKNDKLANRLIIIVSLVVFAAVVALSKVKLEADLPFDVHFFAFFNAIINSLVSILLLAGLTTVLQKRYLLHKRLMVTAILLSVLFLISYIAHHLLAGETKFGDVDYNGLLSGDEKLKAGNLRYVYYFLLLTHIPLAAIILPFILFTAYRSLTGEYEKHKKLAKITWPVWFYVALSGVFVFLLIHPYYH